MSLLLGHILLDLLARFRSRRAATKRPSAEWIERFNNHFRAQHLLLLVSVVTLFVSAVFLFGLRYPGAAWAAALSGALGGPDLWRVVHRIGGTLLIAAAGYHLVYSLIHEAGRRDFRLMLPTKADFAHVWQNLRFFLGLSDRRPAFGRFTYFEKFDYWAVFWGCAIMIGTGLALWFHGLVRTAVPGIPASAFDVFKEAHAHEAVLAFLAIVIWHAYNVHLGAGRFPWNWAWIHGRVRREELEMEHPLDPSIEKPEAGAMA